MATMRKDRKETRNEKPDTESVVARTLPDSGQPAHYPARHNYRCASSDGRRAGMDARPVRAGFYRAGDCQTAHPCLAYSDTGSDIGIKEKKASIAYALAVVYPGNNESFTDQRHRCHHSSGISLFYRGSAWLDAAPAEGDRKRPQRNEGCTLCE